MEKRRTDNASVLSVSTQQYQSDLCHPKTIIATLKHNCGLIRHISFFLSLIFHFIIGGKTKSELTWNVSNNNTSSLDLPYPLHPAVPSLPRMLLNKQRKQAWALSFTSVKTHPFLLANLLWVQSFLVHWGYCWEGHVFLSLLIAAQAFQWLKSSVQASGCACFEIICCYSCQVASLSRQDSLPPSLPVA